MIFEISPDSQQEQGQQLALILRGGPREEPALQKDNQTATPKPESSLVSLMDAYPLAKSAALMTLGQRAWLHRRRAADFHTHWSTPVLITLYLETRRSGQIFARRLRGRMIRSASPSTVD